MGRYRCKIYKEANWRSVCDESSVEKHKSGKKIQDICMAETWWIFKFCH